MATNNGLCFFEYPEDVLRKNPKFSSDENFVIYFVEFAGLYPGGVVNGDTGILFDPKIIDRDSVEKWFENVIERFDTERREDMEDEKLRELVSNIFIKRFTAFLFILMRDHLPIGKVNEIVKDVIGAMDGDVLFSDDMMKNKAESLAAMMYRGEYLVQEIDADYTIRVEGEDDGTDK